MTSFVPDMLMQDWGYGPYFHQTISARCESWFRLPPGLWDEEVWFHRPDEEKRPTVIFIGNDTVIEMDGLSWTVLEVEPDALWLRPEQPRDMWCEAGDQPPPLPVEPIRYSRAELSDSRGHLKFNLKYLKGC